MWTGDTLPAESSLGVGDKEQFVAFAGPIVTAVRLLYAAFPGPAAFG
ncbi:MAG: hypothetical protein JO138_20505 [Acidobacteriaceae bacterium]|nr:hypothetical protein [Acidobacteriaceae bacterium]